jgi:hypothetical protein
MSFVTIMEHQTLNSKPQILLLQFDYHIVKKFKVQSNVRLLVVFLNSSNFLPFKDHFFVMSYHECS